MLKHILAAVLLSLSWAAQAASPAFLLSQQCLQYQISIEDIESLSLEQQAVALERQLLGLFNLSDSVNYYRHYNSTQQTDHTQSVEQLLRCQLTLADKFEQLAKMPLIGEITQRLNQSANNQDQRLGQRLTKLFNEPLSTDDKARSHVLQASILHALKQQKLSLVISQDQCLLKQDETSNGQTKRFSESIASYLIEQSDPNCRKQVWQAYELRAKAKNQVSLAALLSDKQQLAASHQFADYASYRLAEQYLFTPDLVEQFLNAITKPSIAPWDLGLTLNQASKMQIEAISSQALLDNIAEQLKDLGITFEFINSQVMRVWHDQRLLGELYLGHQQRIQASKIRLSVVGHQFGQVSFNYPRVLSDYRSQKQFIQQFSSALNLLVQGGHFYLINSLGESIDSSLVGQYWLATYLCQQLLPPITADSREAYLYQYAQQLKIFRSKLALRFYQGKLDKQAMEQAFKHSFSQPWPQAVDAIYGFKGISNEGPLYYHTLWQQSVAQLIYQTQKCCQNQRQVFEILMINEAQLPFSAQLASLFGEAVSPSILINRIQHGYVSHNL
ncbi:M3 family metallopeptidase [Shewanella sp. Isolate11]|uniref:M3 family metallopeptidase n=1 Tax=Shewanella sp. Isolate11 TaxID=2908530 RepID=UPI001EFE1975|nr:M3 family metallopeptidase [Shewanella sp. Isolate11]MCG9696560.1 M3 family metallopeptidase [Shewanella sp. Isolate11]